MKFILNIPKKLEEMPPLLTSLLGVLTAAIIAIPAFMLGVGLGNKYLANQHLFTEEDIIRLSWIGVVGAQGGALSVIMRLRNMVKDSQPAVLHFLNGLLKPFIGMSFAQFSYMVFASGFIAKPELGERDFYFYVAVAFIAGFSERFAKDLIEKVSGFEDKPADSNK